MISSAAFFDELEKIALQASTIEKGLDSTLGHIKQLRGTQGAGGKLFDRRVRQKYRLMDALNSKTNPGSNLRESWAQ
jgi:hypothetical protein